VVSPAAAAGALFDAGGALAAAGAPVPGALAALVAADAFIAAPPPKSSGREYYSAAYVDRLLALTAGAPVADVLATAARLTAHGIRACVRRASNYERFLASDETAAAPAGELVVTGGGARHAGVMAALLAAFPGWALLPCEAFGFDGDAKEAVAFAFLAAECVRGRPANLPAVTGARCGPRRRRRTHGHDSSRRPTAGRPCWARSARRRRSTRPRREKHQAAAR
jgi:anhydro-N-acetylmuramic acid kinase